jgi:hypothetical protein
MLPDETFICTRYQKLTEKHSLLLLVKKLSANGVGIGIQVMKFSLLSLINKI